MFVNIYQLVWHLLQFIYNIVDILHELCLFANQIYENVKRKLNGEDISFEKRLIENNKVNLTKIPVHLAVILGTETPDFHALSKLIFWCLSAGIPNISFYDYQGFLVSNNHKLHNYLSQWKKDNNRICWNSRTHDVCGGQLVYRNGMKKELSVNFLSPCDCKLKIAEVCRSLADDKNLDPDQLTISKINEKFSSIISPDPDDAVYFGEVCSTYGFLPWHIRLTEFYPVESQQVLTVNKFLNILLTYSKCEQRFGY